MMKRVTPNQVIEMSKTHDFSKGGILVKSETANGHYNSDISYLYIMGPIEKRYEDGEPVYEGQMMECLVKKLYNELSLLSNRVTIDIDKSPKTVRFDQWTGGPDDSEDAVLIEGMSLEDCIANDLRGSGAEKYGNDPECTETLDNRIARLYEELEGAMIQKMRDISGLEMNIPIAIPMNTDNLAKQSNGMEVSDYGRGRSPMMDTGEALCTLKTPEGTGVVIRRYLTGKPMVLKNPSIGIMKNIINGYRNKMQEEAK